MNDEVSLIFEDVEMGEIKIPKENNDVVELLQKNKMKLFFRVILNLTGMAFLLFGLWVIGLFLWRMKYGFRYSIGIEFLAWLLGTLGFVIILFLHSNNTDKEDFMMRLEIIIIFWPTFPVLAVIAIIILLIVSPFYGLIKLMVWAKTEDEDEDVE